MKNFMKILASLLFVLMLFSCSSEMTTTINPKHTFIVNKIIKENSKYSRYYSIGDVHHLDDAYYCLIMPTGWYNVGDTIKLIPTKFCKELK